MSLPWFRFYSEWASDPKVQGLPIEWQRHFVMILCWHASGVLKTFDDEIIADALKMQPKDLAEMKAVFKKRGFISGPKWTPKNWEKRQCVSDNSAPRVAAFRARKKEENKTEKRDVTVTSPLRNGELTAQDRDRELERDKTVVFVAGTHAGENADENQNGIGDPSLACIDALVPEIENTWPDSNWGADAYKLAKTFLPHCVVYGFRTSIAKAWKGEKVTLKRVRGFIEWAQQNGITPEEAIQVETRSSPPPRAKEKPKTKTELLHESIDRSNARLKAKGVKEASMSTLEIAQAEEREKANKKSGE